MASPKVNILWAKKQIRLIMGKAYLCLTFEFIKDIVDRFNHYQCCMKDLDRNGITPINWEHAYSYEIAQRMGYLREFGETRKMKKLAKIARKRGMVVHYFKSGSIMVMDEGDYESWLSQKEGCNGKAVSQ